MPNTVYFLQVSKFLLVGTFNTLLGYSLIFFAMYVLALSPETSNALGYGLGLIVSYGLNRNFTFQSSLAKRQEFFRFLCVFAFAYAANFLILLLLTYVYAINGALSQIMAGAGYFMVSFGLNKRFVFKG